MKKFIKSILLLLPLTFSLGACSTGEDASINIESLISNVSIPDDIADFLYDNSYAKKMLKQIADKDGYSFEYRIENEILPDDSNQSRYYNITLNGIRKISWATIIQTDKDDTKTLARYDVLLEENTERSYYKNGDKWEQIGDKLDIPYSINQLKSLLFLGGQYIPLLTEAGVIKTRVMEVNRECVKYKIEKDPDTLTVIVDRYTQILTHITDIRYTSGSVTKSMLKMTAFKEVAPAIPDYKK